MSIDDDLYIYACAREGPEVRLTWAELNLAGQVGIMRRVIGLKCGWQEVSVSESYWGNEVLGAIGEMGVAKYYNVYWANTVGNPGEPDIGPYQVRSKHMMHHCLIVHEKAKDEDVYISVCVQPPRVVLCGWITAAEAKQEHWWREQPPPKASAYFVPNEALHPMDELPNPFAERERSDPAAG